jgi:hypothetical protein
LKGYGKRVIENGVPNRAQENLAQGRVKFIGIFSKKDTFSSFVKKGILLTEMYEERTFQE